MSRIVKFIRSRDYRLIKELGNGACGKTVLLHDDVINERFVCKKFQPISEIERDVLFQRFVLEVKILYKLTHPNIVRIFNYYMYPADQTGYILMEFVDGIEIDDYVKNNPERINELFVQAIEGFSYLESKNILHRDIRAGNLMVNEKNELKIIDLGFGKMVESSDDFDKSISLNYWCELPLEFHSDVYDFCTEVYFVGKLFEKLIQVNDIEDFKYRTVLDQMCRRDSHERTGTFADISTRVKNEQFYEIEFDLNERRSYQEFSGAIRQHIAKIEKSAKYVVDVRLFQADLEDVYRNVMLASEIPDPNVVIRCIINGSYTYYRKRFSVNTLRDFVHLLKSSSEEKSRIILANLHTLLNSIERFTEKMLDDDEIPF